MLQKGTGRSVVELVLAVPESVVVVLEVKDAVAKHRRRYEPIIDFLRAEWWR